MIYLASPYSHPDPAIREARFRAVCLHAARMVVDGLMVFSPIAHSHPICVSGGLQGDFERWQAFNTAMLARCQSLAVLQLPGWINSHGTIAEIHEAGQLGLPIVWRQPAADELAIVREVEQARATGAPLPDEIRFRAAVAKAVGQAFPHLAGPERTPRQPFRPRPQTCGVCGATYTPKRRSQLYCSQTCGRKAAARKRTKGK